MPARISRSANLHGEDGTLANQAMPAKITKPANLHGEHGTVANLAMPAKISKSAKLRWSVAGSPYNLVRKC